MGSSVITARSAQDQCLFLGVHAHGTVRETVTYWVEVAHVRGREGARTLRGYGVDVGLTSRLRLPWQPALTVGVAFGSGDTDPTGRVDRSFRQTGLHDNEGTWAGVAKFKYYGELLDPELSNLLVLTGGSVSDRRAPAPWISSRMRIGSTPPRRSCVTRASTSPRSATAAPWDRRSSDCRLRADTPGEGPLDRERLCPRRGVSGGGGSRLLHEGRGRISARSPVAFAPTSPAVGHAGSVRGGKGDMDSVGQRETAHAENGWGSMEAHTGGHPPRGADAHDHRLRWSRVATGNFHTVVPGTLYRSGQLTEGQWAAYIHHYGIKSVLNLRGAHRASAWYQGEVRTAAQHGVAHYDVHMSAIRELDPGTRNAFWRSCGRRRSRW